ncbi:MAG: response regulator [Candidatus Omnitrophica bacterium]|nr:response regulator [Candidatus Omnitrophota bacterium]
MVRKILIIDDEVDFCRLVKKNLEIGGDFKVEIAVNGKDGINLAVKLKPHLILLDILMPDMDGFQVLEELNRGPKKAFVPVIVLSAKGDDATRILALSKQGVKLFINKPIGAGELKNKIKSILRNT